MRCIEIDDLNSWQAVYAPFFARLAPAAEWARWLDPEDYGSSDANVTKLANFLQPGSSTAMGPLRDQVEEFFRANFTHAVYYHACRITNPADYERDGLRCCDIAEQNRRAIEVWGDAPHVKAALRSGQAWAHAKSCHGKVGLWYSRAGAVHDGDGYTGGGSEYLRVISNALGPEYRAKLEARGRPALVRCVLSLEETHPEVVRSYSVLPLKWQLTYRDPVAPPGFYALGWAFMHEKPVPPGQITIEYLD